MELGDTQKRYLRWVAIALFLVALYLSFGWLCSLAVSALQQDPTVWAAYKVVEAEVRARSLLGLFYATAFGALVFLAIPVEVVFLWYLGMDYPVVPLIGIALAGTLLGNFVNYLFGFAIGPKPLKKMIGEQYGVFRTKIDRAGGFIVIVGNIVPFPNDALAVFLGAVRYNPLLFLLYNAIGKGVQYFLFWLSYKYISSSIGPYIDLVSVSWLVELVRSSF